MKTTEQFIKQAKEIHGDRYDYSKVNYKGCREKICIICPEHGEFWQRADTHLEGKGCQKCGHISTGLKTRKNSPKVFENLDYPNITIIDNPNLSTKDDLYGTIYIFINKINNKSYIGQTLVKYTDRWSKHKLSSGKLDYKIYKAIRKYGWDNFDKFVIWQTPRYDNNAFSKDLVKKLLDDKEKFYIKLYNSINSGYNTTEGGEGNIQKKSEKTKVLLKYITGAKPVNQYDLQHNLIKTWLSMTDIKNELGFCKDGVRECCYKERDSYKDFIWEFAPIDVLPKHEKVFHEAIVNKIILQYDLSGKFIKEWKSATLIKDTLGFNDHCIRGCCRGMYKTSNNFIWKYKDSTIEECLSKEELEQRGCFNKRIYQYSKDLKLIKIWDKIEDILENNPKFKRTNLRNCLNKKNKTSYSYIWKYEEDI